MIIQNIIDNINKEEIKKAITVRKGTLKTNSQGLNGLNKYVWRMIRFHCGIDCTIPICCFFDLQRFLKENNISYEQVNVCGIINEEGKILLDTLDKLVEEIALDLKLNSLEGAKRWNGLLY